MPILFLVALTAAVLGLGWWLNDGDPVWGRLVAFPLPERLVWVDLLPPLTVLLLTRWGAPVSTSFLLLTAVAPSRSVALLLRSLVGYGLAFAAALVLYGTVFWWLALQALATGWLWSQWLVHDLANIYVYLPRQLAGGELALSAAVLALGLAVLVATGGGPIQQVVRGKTASTDLRSATLIDLLRAWAGLALSLVLARLIHPLQALIVVS